MFANSETLIRLMPEIILVALATWIFIGGTFWANRAFWSTLAMLTYLVAAIALYRHGNAPLVMSVVTIDYLGYTLRWLALLSGAVLTLMASYHLRDQLASEALGLIMLAATGTMLVACAGDLVLMFLGLELISIPTYVLLYVARPGREAAEATAKYFFLSILSSALLLYGFSFLYGLAGTTMLVGEGGVLGIQQQLVGATGGSATGLAALAPLAIVLIFAGLGFKIAAVPFHFYAPDVYQGTTNTNAGLLAVLPKIAGLVALVRIAVIAMPAIAAYAWHLSLIIAVLTMTIGNVCALWQTNLRRMLGYSSIAHAGYMLIGLTVALGANAFGSGEVNPGYGGVGALVFYLVVYVFATLGAFAVLAQLSTPEQDVATLDEVAGLNKIHPTSAALMAVFMFSLAGVPPLAGFWGKLTLFMSAVGVVTYSTNAAITPWFVVLVVAGALNAAIAAAYYLRVVSAMYFRPVTNAAPQVPSPGGIGAALICAVVVIVIGISPRALMTAARAADEAARTAPSLPVNVATDVSPASAAMAQR